MTSIGSLIWWLIIGGAFFFIMRKGGGCCGGGHTSSGSESKGTNQLTMTNKGKDPVCGMEISQDTAPFGSKFKDRAFYFCSEQCMKLFELNPHKYVGASAAPTPTASCCSHSK